MIKGDDVFIADGVIFKRPHLVKIGNRVAIDHGFYCTTRLEIGNFVHISPYVTVIGGEIALLKIGSFVTISAGARLTCISDTFDGTGLVGPLIPYPYRNSTIGDKIIISDFASIASNAVIMPGIIIGEGSVVGAGSYINFDTRPWTIYIGKKVIRERPKEKMLEYAKALGYE